MKPLIIVGCSEIARLAYEYFTHDCDEYEVMVFTVDRDYIESNTFMGKPVTPYDEIEKQFPPDTFDAFVAIGSQKLNSVRAEKYDDLKAKGYRLASYVSSRAFVWHNVTIGENSFILEDNTLQPFVEIGNDVTLWSGNHIGHGTKVEDHVFISSHVVVSGLCTIGAYTFMGVNSATAEGVEIGADNFIALGAAITRSTKPDALVKPPAMDAKEDMAKRFSRRKG
ncbi:MAG: sugar O-acyltransferase [Alphaproteobacteria bacterium]|nr:sugar O-acyltransferase [Alphaproteobacteria bacterium]